MALSTNYGAGGRGEKRPPRQCPSGPVVRAPHLRRTARPNPPLGGLADRNAASTTSYSDWQTVSLPISSSVRPLQRRLESRRCCWGRGGDRAACCLIHSLRQFPGTAIQIAIRQRGYSTRGGFGHLMTVQTASRNWAKRMTLRSFAPMGP